jgi:peptidoglycan-associated lipoprotein
LYIFVENHVKQREEVKQEMRRGIVWTLGSVLLVFLMLMEVSCAKKVVTEEQAPAKAPAAAPAPAPAPKEEAKAPPPAPPPAPSAFAETKKVFEAAGIYFDFDKYNLKPEAIKVLDEKVAFLKEYPQVKVLIAGNCDPRGSNEYNLALGDRRANAAKSYMVKAGIAENRLSTISYGEEKLICTESTEACWAKCRRDDFVVQ